MTSCRTCLAVSRDRAKEAAELWTTLVPDSRIERIIELDGPNDPIVIDLVIAGAEYQILGAHLQDPSQASSFFLAVPDQAALDRVWDGFLERGGSELECAWITDPFGFAWQIVPEPLLEGMRSERKEVRQAAVEPVWRMRRVDVATVEASIAAAGDDR